MRATNFTQAEEMWSAMLRILQLDEVLQLMHVHTRTYADNNKIFMWQLIFQSLCSKLAEYS